jgi:hypothetical protein
MVQAERNQGPISVVFLVHAGLFPIEPPDHPGTAFGSEPLKGGLSFLATAGVGVVELR